jgi:hypothetical protein
VAVLVPDMFFSLYAVNKNSNNSTITESREKKNSFGILRIGEKILI